MGHYEFQKYMGRDHGAEAERKDLFEHLFHMFDKNPAPAKVRAFCQEYQKVPLQVLKNALRELVDRNEFFPKPHEVKAAINKHMPEKSQSALCKLCDGKGYTYVRRNDSEFYSQFGFDEKATQSIATRDAVQICSCRGN